MNRPLLAAVLVLSLAACSEDPEPPHVPPDGGADAGTDAGVDGGIDAGPDDGGSTSSGGAGKLPCDGTGTVTSNGQTYAYCVARVAGVELKIVEPRGGIVPRPVRLAIYLHGDGARAHTRDDAPRAQAPWAYVSETLYVSALAPNRCSWWTRPSLTTCTGTPTETDRDVSGENASALADVIDALRKRWDIVNEPILFGGSAGGSVFLTGSFLPRYGSRFRGLHALGCGGTVSWSGALEWDGNRPEQRGSTRLFYVYGDRDPALADIQASIAAYRGYAIPVGETVIAGAAGCGFDDLGAVRDLWERNLGPL
ncbi:hypothetical protein NVS55_38945 [Myxococcus stipitatus]|uniref:hypothetical protein n=1 Tax=Myxococcus stipitatus TaxID=83455 RepID=UPI0031452D13